MTGADKRMTAVMNQALIEACRDAVEQGERADRAELRITALESQNARMKAALEALRSRDTLHLGPLADGEWARELIDAALRESQ